MSIDEQEDSTRDYSAPETDGQSIIDGAMLSEALICAKEEERLRIKSEVDEFLNRGGEIIQVGSNVMAEPPKRPQSNYGGQPI